mmetsp:Transcript_119167/g.282780  ORF Transcript_119167/g.282780 Transcript_119167/m.282780 type:complete len:470 (-) Transcript_119167:36-1445(-)
MYRFQVSCDTQWGEEVCILGSASSVACWDVRRAIPLRPLSYPLWKSDPIDVSDVGPPEEVASRSKRLEYKYVIRGPRGVTWEHGNNRWVPVETGRLTVHDGFFGHIQPYPFSFEEDDHEDPEAEEDTPERHHAASGWRVLVLGSSVAEGYNTWRKRGWAWRLKEALQHYGHNVVNASRCGANVTTTKEHLREVAINQKPQVVIIALSLGNEGLAHCPKGERRAAQHRFEQGLLDLISMVLEMDAMPILGGVYPNNDYDLETYAMLQETARTMATWDVPIFDWLSALDDGRGRWKEGLFFDHAHPNSEGQLRMFERIDLSLFDTSQDLPELVRRRSSLTQLDLPERRTSYGSMDEGLQASQREESEAQGAVVGPPIFEDGRGFSVVVCRGAISIRNKTEHEYILSPAWKELSDALAGGVRPGIYVSNDECCENSRVLFVSHERRLTRRLVLPPSADALYLPSFFSSGQDR